LESIREAIAKGHRVDPPQPVLQRKGETRTKALHRYLREIRHPLVRHRLILLQRLLVKLEKEYGIPDLVVMEAVRSLALSPKRKRKLNKRNEEHRQNREQAVTALKTEKQSTSKNSIQRYRLWKEVKGLCPFCKQPIIQRDLYSGAADIEHMVPRHRVDSSEWVNLTVGHLKCNREIKADRTPHEAFASSTLWPSLKKHAEDCFRGRKLEIFLSPNAEELLENKADLQHTAYIARVARHVTLLQFNWLGKDGRDPTPEKQNPALSFQVTNGQLTSRLRRAWGLNQILHPITDCRRWDDLTEAEQEQFKQKNRGDHRHHALDAMVIACTLPWFAHRSVRAKDRSTGEDGWWDLDETTQRSIAINPVFPREGEMRRVAEAQMEKLVVQHHTSRSNHRQAYYTTLYGRKGGNTYVAREPLGKRTPKNLNNIYPTELADYCQAAWLRYEDESPDIATELKKAKRAKRGLPAAFEAKLCFSNFQRWREQAKRGESHFDWPKEIKIPIRNVKVIGVHDDTAVAPAAPGTHAFVKRGVFKEVRIYPSPDGKTWVPVFIPYGKHDQPVAGEEWDATAKPVKIIRRGDTINLKNGSGPSNPPGLYRVASTMQKQIQLLPVNLADTKEALLASGFLANGANIRWQTFFTAMAHELPHPPSAQPPVTGSD
jgi:5-methylcytosine-specific restriction endonuclease McrA